MKLRSGTSYIAIQRLQNNGLLRQYGRRPAADRDDQRRRYYQIAVLGQRVARLEAARLDTMLQTAQQKALIDLGNG